MKFFVLSRGDQTSDQLSALMKQKLLNHDFIYEADTPDIVITVGGDGTLLNAFHQYVHRLNETAFVGVHTGHLGFYADWRPQEVERLVYYITSQELETVDYPLLEVTIEHKTQDTQRYLSLNECTVKTVEGSLVVDVEINDEHFETFRGDGLCVATPSGSTAYNKSLGGALLHPSLPAIQMTEMASINNRVYRTIGSPLVFPAHHTCKLSPVNDRSYQISIDHLTFMDNEVKEILFKVAREKVRFARYQRFPFWKRVKESFIDET
ncbi:NAD kinase [Caldalkalibacillus salinus]|uniref:NAD kinase n=1 Tax=Caldalkalibacillus salinus TaxID=2803787 RepID=UPI001920945B|nr:NAD kinase [Caldalkalibacillus salinus]